MKQYVKLVGNGWSKDILNKIVPVTSESKYQWESKTADSWFKISKDPRSGYYGELVNDLTNDQLIKNITELTELDILAEKIFVQYTIHRLALINRKVDEAYELAQDFLNYRESRKK